MERRWGNYSSLQDRIIERTRTFFKGFLNERGYSGDITFNHDKEKLYIEVVMDHASRESIKDAKLLSGGERSFTTINFIMSLWDAMEAPFRCLDEFDVFMVSLVGG